MSVYAMQCHAYVARLWHLLTESKLPYKSIWFIPLDYFGIDKVNTIARSPRLILGCHSGSCTGARRNAMLPSFLVRPSKIPAHWMDFRPMYEVLTYHTEGSIHKFYLLGSASIILR